MEINNLVIKDLTELSNLLKDGINPLDYVKDITNVEFISKVITKSEDNADPFFDDMSGLLLKAIILYLLYVDTETKSLKRCKEIIDIEVNNTTQTRKLPDFFNSLNYDHPAKVCYTSIYNMPENTYYEICNCLSKKLSKLNI